MNKEFMLDLANLLEKMPAQKLIMESWFDDWSDSFDIDNECSSACCIAGWAFVLDKGGYWEPLRSEDTEWESDFVMERAQELLGLNKQEASHLFMTSTECIWYKYRNLIDPEGLIVYDFDDDVFESNKFLYLDDTIIPPVVAAKALRMIVNGEIVLDYANESGFRKNSYDEREYHILEDKETNNNQLEKA